VRLKSLEQFDPMCVLWDVQLDYELEVKVGSREWRFRHLVLYGNLSMLFYEIMVQQTKRYRIILKCLWKTWEFVIRSFMSGI
jgi:hypothetical protein